MFELVALEFIEICFMGIVLLLATHPLGLINLGGASMRLIISGLRFLAFSFVAVRVLSLEEYSGTVLRPDFQRNIRRDQPFCVLLDVPKDAAVSCCFTLAAARREISA